MMIRTTAAAMAIGIMVAGSASAQNSSEGDIIVQGQPAAYVGYEDINLRNTAGVETLNRRVTRAAKQICGDTGNVETLRIRLNENACVQSALDSAQPQIESAIRNFE